MNKTDFVNKVSELSELSKKDSAKAVDAFMETVLLGLEEDSKVQLVGFGNFELRERSARKGRNPQTGEEINIPASIYPSFKASKPMKERFK